MRPTSTTAATASPQPGALCFSSLQPAAAPDDINDPSFNVKKTLRWIPSGMKRFNAAERNAKRQAHQEKLEKVAASATGQQKKRMKELAVHDNCRCTGSAHDFELESRHRSRVVNQAVRPLPGRQKTTLSPNIHAGPDAHGCGTDKEYEWHYPRSKAGGAQGVPFTTVDRGLVPDDGHSAYSSSTTRSSMRSGDKKQQRRQRGQQQHHANRRESWMDFRKSPYDDDYDDDAPDIVGSWGRSQGAWTPPVKFLQALLEEQTANEERRKAEEKRGGERRRTSQLWLKFEDENEITPRPTRDIARSFASVAADIESRLSKTRATCDKLGKQGLMRSRHEAALQREFDAMGGPKAREHHGGKRPFVPALADHPRYAASPAADRLKSLDATIRRKNRQQQKQQQQQREQRPRIMRRPKTTPSLSASLSPTKRGGLLGPLGSPIHISSSDHKLTTRTRNHLVGGIRTDPGIPGLGSTSAIQHAAAAGRSPIAHRGSRITRKRPSHQVRLRLLANKRHERVHANNVAHDIYEARDALQDWRGTHREMAATYRAVVGDDDNEEEEEEEQEQEEEEDYMYGAHS